MRLVLALTTISALLAQQSGDQPPVVLKSTTRLVQVSVIAQDGKGQPVTDLKKDDFRIKVNGKDQPIKIFSMDSSRRAAEGRRETSARCVHQSHGGQTRSAVERHHHPARHAQHPMGRSGLCEGPGDPLFAHPPPEDHIGLYTLGTSLRVLHDYTADSAELLSRLEALKGKAIPDMTSKEPTDAMHGDALLLDALQRGVGGASPAERVFYTTQRIIGTLKAIEFIANHLAKTPGRKNLIWVSGGFPLEIGFDNAAAWRNPQIDQRTFTDEVSETVRAVNDANMAIYPVDARGLMVAPHSMPSAAATAVACRKLPQMVGVKNQQTMEELASRTGGHAYYNSNDLAKAIHSAVDDSRVTYMLGFYPVDESFDGKFHKIEVQAVERKGVHLRYRKGFFDLPELPQDEKARKTELADAAWSPLDASGIGIAAKIVAIQDQTRIARNCSGDRQHPSQPPAASRPLGRPPGRALHPARQRRQSV